MPDIVTGYELDVGSASGEFEALFSPDTPLGQLYSPRVEIKPGKVFKFIAFNLPEDGEIRMLTVSPGSLESQSHRHCMYNPDFIPGVDLYYQRMTLTGEANWTLTADNPQMLVSLPGLYRFKLKSETMLGGDLRLEFYSWDVRHPPFFPVLR
jgi:hypothetical protein